MTWTTWLADIAIKSSVVLLCALVANRLFLRHKPAATRHAVWILALASSLAAPALTAFLPHWHVPLLRVAAVQVASPESPLTLALSPQAGRGDRDVQATQDSTAVETPAVDSRTAGFAAPTRANRRADEGSANRSGQVDVRTQPEINTSPSPRLRGQGRGEGFVSSLMSNLPAGSTLAFGLWTLVAGLLLLRQTVATLRTARLSRRARTPGRAPWMTTARALARSIGAPGTRFLRSEAISMPIACGLLKPTVVLPAEADVWPEDRVRVVLLHELAHVRRRDCLTQAVADAACAVFWFNPLAWMAVRELRRERERACDDMVLAAGTRGPDYAAHLLDIARAMRGASLDSVFSSGVAMAHRSELEGRLMAILDDARPRRALSARGLAFASTFSILLVTPLAAMNPWVFDETSNVGQLPSPTPTPTPSPSPSPSPRIARGHGEGHGEPGHRDEDARDQAVIDAAVAEGIDSIAADVSAAVTASVEEGVSGGISGGVSGGVIGGIVGGIAGPHIATSIATNVNVHAVIAGDHGQDKERKPADPKMVAALTEAMKDSDAEVRKAAIQALVQMRDPSTFDAMVIALKDKDDEVRQQAAFSLGQMRDKRALTALSGALGDTNAEVRQQAVFALGQLRDISTLDAIATALKDSDAEVRQQAAFALSQLRDARAVPALIVALQDKDEEVRQQAAFALSQIRDPKAVDGLLIAIKDSNAEVRQQALFALGQIGDPRAADAAMLLLKDPDPEVRQQAAHALGQMLRHGRN